MNEKDLMLTSILKCRRVDLATGSRELTEPQKSEFGKMVERRAHGEPLQYVIGHCDFMGTTLSVDKRVLIPRHETELLVELAIAKIKSLRLQRTPNILDLGTGSGNIAIALAKHIYNSSITALDVHQGALTLALRNAKENSVDHRVQFFRTDMTEYLKQARQWNVQFDMIISNPPYIQTSDLDHLPSDVCQEPQLALDGGKDGLKFIRSIIQYAQPILKSSGFLLLEIGDDQFGPIEKIFKTYPLYTNVSFHKDYIGTKRIVTAQVGIARERSVQGSGRVTVPYAINHGKINY